MQRFLVLTTLLFAACGPSASHKPTTVTITTDDNLECTDEVSPTTGMTHRVCHAPVTVTGVRPGEEGLICTEETPTGTYMAKRVCRSQAEIDHDKKLAGDIFLHPSSRVGCDPQLAACQKGLPR